MAKITRLPSGSYHAQVYAGKDEQGKRKYKSFTGDTREEVRRAVALWEVSHEHESKPATMTLETAMNNYTKNRINILSPTTYKYYDMISRLYFTNLHKLPITQIDEKMIQGEVDKMAATLSPKSIRNACGFLRTVFTEYRPEFRYKLEYPQRIKSIINIPTDAEMREVLEEVKGSDMELPILFAACLGMRRSEVLGVKWSDIDLKRKTLTIKQVIVYDVDNKPVEKAPKSYSGTRTAVLPDMVIDALNAVPEAQRTGRVVNLQGYQVTERFIRLLDKLGIKHYRFHDLRHYFASVMYSLNIPPKYAASRMGHADETMINRVYAHIIQSKEDEHTQQINAYFGKMQNEIQHGI